MTLVTLVFAVLAVLAFRGSRRAYFAFVILGVLFFPARVGFQFHPRPCECALNVPLALFSLTKYGHLVRFAIFFLMTAAQLPGRSLRAQLLIASGAVLAMGIYVEVAEGVTGNGTCRLRDLIPDMAGAAVGGVLLLLWRFARRDRAPAGG